MTPLNVDEPASELSWDMLVVISLLAACIFLGCV